MKIIIKIHKKKDVQNRKYLIFDENGYLRGTAKTKGVAEKVAYDLAGSSGNVEYKECECCTE